MSEFGIKTLALLQTAATAACQTVLTEDIQFNVQRLTEKIEKHVSQIHKTNQLSKQDNNQNMQQNEQSKEYPPLQIRILPEKKNEKRKRLQKNIIQTQLQKKQIKNNANITECCKYDCKKTFHKTHNPLLKTVQLHCLHKLHIQCACDIFINKKRKPSLPLLCPVCAFPVHHTILKDFHWAAFKDMKGGIRAAYQFKKDVLVPLAIGTQSIKEYLHQFAMIRQDKSYRDLF